MSSLSELRDRARRIADAEGNNFFSDAEINDHINTGLGELHDILVLKFEDYYVNSASFSLVRGKSVYSLADNVSIGNFYKVIGVDITQGGATIRVPRHSFSGRNAFRSDQAARTSRGFPFYEYRLSAKNIIFIPEPTSEEAIRIWYIPSYTKLSTDESTVDDRIALNWEEYAVYSAAIKMRHKEETSTTSLERELERLKERIEEASANRDAGESIGIVDDAVGIQPGY